jgi:hypothetical protein
MEVQAFTEPRAYFDAALPLTKGLEAASAMFLSIVKISAALLLLLLLMR